MPLAAGAQQPGKGYRIGLLETGALRPRPWAAFKERMRELGYVEGQTAAFEPRWADGQLDRLPGLAAELLRLKVDVIVTAGSQAAQAAKSATPTVPIVMATGGDPVGLGLVDSLARPGGNVTGMTTLSRELSGKRLEVFREALPGVSRMGMLWQRSSKIDALLRSETEQAAQTLGISLRRTESMGRTTSTALLAAIVAERGGAVLVGPAHVPAIAGHTPTSPCGVVCPRCSRFASTWRPAGSCPMGRTTRTSPTRRGYVDRILKGAKPATYPSSSRRSSSWSST